MITNTEQRLLRPREVQKILAIGLATVYKLINTGQLPCVRLNGSVRIPKALFEEWFDEQEALAGGMPADVQPNTTAAVMHEASPVGACSENAWLWLGGGVSILTSSALPGQQVACSIRGSKATV